MQVQVQVQVQVQIQQQVQVQQQVHVQVQVQDISTSTRTSMSTSTSTTSLWSELPKMPVYKQAILKQVEKGKKTCISYCFLIQNVILETSTWLQVQVEVHVPSTTSLGYSSLEVPVRIFGYYIGYARSTRLL